jgi:hypothetical protein
VEPVTNASDVEVARTKTADGRKLVELIDRRDSAVEIISLPPDQARTLGVRMMIAAELEWEEAAHG